MKVDEELQLYTDLIKKHAQVAFKKIKKPVSYSLEDLIQEGVAVFLYARKDYTKSKGASFKTFLTKCLRNHFASLVRRSYRNKEISTSTWDSFQVNSSSKEMVLMNKDSAVDAFEIVQTSFIIEDFNDDELDYVKAMLSFTHKHRRSRRKEARAALGISYERERKLRGSIKDKIRK